MCAAMEPSLLLLHASGGTVILAGYMDCQEFALEGGKYNPLQAPFRERLGTKVDFSNRSLAAVDYGKHWTVLKNSGLVQCLVDGKPETLFDLADCRVVTVLNPKVTMMGADYSIDVETSSTKIVLRAEHPSDHADWSLALESILKKEGREGILRGNRCDECGYMALKRLIMMNAAVGEGGGGSGLYSLPPRFNDMEDIYTVTSLGGPASCPISSFPPRSSSIAVPRGSGSGPFPSRNGMSPPALPPKRSATGPTSPEHGVPSPASLGSTVLPDAGEMVDEYIAMEPLATPPSTKENTTLPRSFSISSAGLALRSTPLPSSQPIMVPNRRPSKQSSLLRNDSESSSYTNSPPVFGSSLGECDHFCKERLSGGQLTPLHGHQGYGNQLVSRDLSSTSLHDAEHGAPPLPPRSETMNRGQRPLVSGSSYTRTPSFSNLQRSNSSLSRMSPLAPTTTGGSSKWSQSEGMMVSEVQRQLSHPVGTAGFLSQSLVGSDMWLDRSNSSLNSDQGKASSSGRSTFVKCIN